jgi:CRP/FNR family cyclic AMP-dependent transcriptional regulator
MSADLPIREIRRRLSWVDFLAPLPEEELDDLARRAGFVRLEEGDVQVVGPEEQAERMLLLVAGQLQVYELSLSSERELTLSVLADGSAVAATGLVPRWVRNLHVRALEPSVVCRVNREDLEALVRRNPEVGLRLARMLATQLMLMEDRWADVVEKEVSARLAGLLYMLVESEGVMTSEGPMIPTHYTHRQLASMIGSQRGRHKGLFGAAGGRMRRGEEPPSVREGLGRPEAGCRRVSVLRRTLLALSPVR